MRLVKKAMSCLKIPDIVSIVRKLMKKNAFVRRLTEDIAFRIKLSLYATLFFNGIYAAFQFALGFYHISFWFYAVATYYFLLAFVRFLLLKHTISYDDGENREYELRRYRFCGVCLMLMNITLSIIIFYVVWQNRTIKHHMITTIALAVYTFITLGIAISNFIRYEKHKNPIFAAARTTSLAAALVSLFTLENVLLSVFGEGESDSFRRIVLGLTGAFVMGIILALAALMIIRGTRELKNVENRISKQK